MVKLSIITPVLNGKRYLHECLESVATTGEYPVEHIVVDGGSTDGTLDILRNWAETHPYTRWISGKDKGQSAAMNRGLQLAQGEWVGFLNADDYYHPNTLPRIFSLIDNTSADFIYANCEVLNQETGSRTLSTPPPLTFIHLLKGKGYPINPCSYFYRKTLHTKIGPYAESDHYTMDLAFLIPCARLARCLYFNETWGTFRFVSGAKTFDEIQSGKTFERTDTLLDKYRRNAPWRIRMEVALYRQYRRLRNVLSRKWPRNKS